MTDELNRYRAPALDKGLDVLELLSEHEEGLSQAEIAKALSRSPSELYRMLDTLVRRDYVRRSGADDRLMLGLKLFALATRHPPMRRLLQAASDVTADIAARTFQSCHLSFYRDGNLFVAVQADSPGRFGVSVRLGAPVDLLTTGSGLVMLAFQTARRRVRMLDARGTRGLDEATDRSLAAIRAAGHVRRDSRQTVGITDLAVPILGRTGDAVAALSIPYITRLEPPDTPGLDECLRLLRAGARMLSTEMPAGLSGELDGEEAVA